MGNKKTWLIIKGALLALFVLSVIIEPSRNDFQLFTRGVMLFVISVSFLMDLYDYRKGK